MRRRQRALQYLTPALIVGVVAAGPVGAQTVTGLFNTGVDGSGSPLADNATDPHWSFVSGLVGNPAGPGTPGVVSCQNGAWTSPGSAAKWTATDTFGCSAMAVASFTFFQTFTLGGFDLTTVALSGNWSSDNVGFGIFLNGTQIEPTNGGAFGTLHPFSTGPSATPLFVNGVNTLAVQFNNSGGPGAFLVRDLVLTGQAAPVGVVPEPATVTLLGAGLALVAGVARRRRRAA